MTLWNDLIAPLWNDLIAQADARDRELQTAAEIEKAKAAHHARTATTAALADALEWIAGPGIAVVALESARYSNTGTVGHAKVDGVQFTVTGKAVCITKNCETCSHLLWGPDLFRTDWPNREKYRTAVNDKIVSVLRGTTKWYDGPDTSNFPVHKCAKTVYVMVDIRTGAVAELEAKGTDAAKTEALARLHYRVEVRART